MQTTAYPDVVDALLAKFRGLNLISPTDRQPVVVFDGYSGPSYPNLFVQVGGEPEPTADGKQEWISLGSSNGGVPASRDELVTIHCYVFSAIGGDDDLGQSGASDAQKTARDNAFYVVRAIESALRSDVFLANGGTPVLRYAAWASFAESHFIVTQTSGDDEDAAQFRKCRVDFDVSYRNRLYS